jgi:hypothetical protein
MTKEEKLERVCRNFLSLSEEKRDYILGILQALVFANERDSAIGETTGTREEPTGEIYEK